jgi:thiol-disulfide isomerase/thioredoxin
MQVHQILLGCIVEAVRDRPRQGYDRRMNRRNFIYGAAAVAAVATTGYFIEHARRQASADSPGSPASREAAQAAQARALNSLFALTLPSPDGTPHALSDWSGHALLVNFWATWCAPCVREMPELDTLSKNHKGVQFVGIGLDSGDNIRAFARKVPVSYPLLVMENGGTDLIGQLGNDLKGLPYTLVLDSALRVVYRVLGPVQPIELQPVLDQLAAKS